MKCKALLLSVIMLMAIATSSMAQTYMGNQEDIDQILENIESFSQYYMNEDYDKLAAAYTENGRILPPGADIIEGHDAIKKRWILPDGFDVLHHEIMPTEINIVGDYAYDVGYYEGKTKRPNGEVSSFKGKYVIVWKKVDDEWLIHLDAWNNVRD